MKISRATPVLFVEVDDLEAVIAAQKDAKVAP